MSSSIYNSLNYDVLVLPVLTNLSASIGSSEGHSLTINGSGFGTDPSALDIRVAGVSCPVINLQPNSLVCNVQ
jgi:hypothetical protein